MGGARDGRRRLGVAEDGGRLRDRETGVGGDGDGAGFVDGGVRCHPVKDLLVGEVDGDAVAFRHTGGGQASGQPVRLRVPPGEREGCAGVEVAIADLVGMAPGHEAQLVREELGHVVAATSPTSSSPRRSWCQPEVPSRCSDA